MWRRLDVANSAKVLHTGRYHGRVLKLLRSTVMSFPSFFGYPLLLIADPYSGHDTKLPLRSHPSTTGSSGTLILLGGVIVVVVLSRMQASIEVRGNTREMRADEIVTEEASG